MDGEKCSVAYSPLGVTRHKSNKFSPKDKSDPVCVSHRLWWWSRNGCATSEDILWKLDALQTFVSDLHWPDEVFSEHLSQRLQTMSNEMVEAAAQRLLYTFSLLPLSLCFQLSRIKTIFLQSSDTWLGDRKGIRPVKSRLLVCWWWRFDWSFARLLTPVVTTTSIILSSLA